MAANDIIWYECNEEYAAIICQWTQIFLWLACLSKHIGTNPSVPHLTVPFALRDKVQSVGDLDELIQQKQKTDAIQQHLQSLRQTNQAFTQTRLDRLKGLWVEVQRIVQQIFDQKQAEFTAASEEIDGKLQYISHQFDNVEHGNFADILLKSGGNVEDLVKVELVETDNIEFLTKALHASIQGKTEVKMIRNLRRPIFNIKLLEPSDELFFFNDKTQTVLQYSIGIGYVGKQQGPPEIFQEGSGYVVLETGVFICGGRSQGKITGATHLYNPVANISESLPELLERRQFHAIAALDLKVHVFGGYGGINLNSAEEFDIPQMRWTKLPDMPLVEGFPTATSLQSCIYLTGANFNSVYCYDPIPRTYRKLDILLPQGATKTIATFADSLVVILPNREYQITEHGTTINAFNGDFGMNWWNRWGAVTRNSSLYTIFWQGAVMKHDFKRQAQVLLDF